MVRKGYDSRTENSDALEEAVQRLNEFLGIPVANLQAMEIYSRTECETLAGLFTPFLFDIIEFQYDKLSFSEKADFQERINESFQKDHVPFRLNDMPKEMLGAREYIQLMNFLPIYP